jgi:hypothetical protein
MIDFETLGYKNITEDKPIRFSEYLGEFFESVYPYDKRYYRKDGCIEIELKVGNHYDLYFISGICYYPKGWQKFEIINSEKHIVEYLNKTLIAVKDIIAENLERYGLRKEI